MIIYGILSAAREPPLTAKKKGSTPDGGTPDSMLAPRWGPKSNRFIRGERML
jgi:hypothetical protein